jgi:hypothetical protein
MDRLYLRILNIDTSALGMQPKYACDSDATKATKETDVSAGVCSSYRDMVIRYDY